MKAMLSGLDSTYNELKVTKGIEFLQQTHIF